MRPYRRLTRWLARELTLWGCFIFGVLGAFAIVAGMGRQPAVAIGLLVAYESVVIYIGYSAHRKYVAEKQSDPRSR